MEVRDLVCQNSLLLQLDAQWRLALELQWLHKRGVEAQELAMSRAVQTVLLRAQRVSGWASDAARLRAALRKPPAGDAAVEAALAAGRLRAVGLQRPLQQLLARRLESPAVRGLRCLRLKQRQLKSHMRRISEPALEILSSVEPELSRSVLRSQGLQKMLQDSSRDVGSWPGVLQTLQRAHGLRPCEGSILESGLRHQLVPWSISAGSSFAEVCGL